MLSDAAARDALSNILITDISHDGLMASNIDCLLTGDIVTLDVPLIGARKAEVRWVAGNRAGCCFAAPLTHEELRSAVFASPLLATTIPDLVSGSMQ